MHIIDVKRTIYLYTRLVKWKLSLFIILMVILGTIPINRMLNRSRNNYIYDIITNYPFISIIITGVLTVGLVIFYKSVEQEYRRKNKDLLFWLKINRANEILLWIMCMLPWWIVCNQLGLFILKLVVPNNMFLLVWYICISVACVGILFFNVEINLFNHSHQYKIYEFNNYKIELLSIIFIGRMRNLKYLLGIIGAYALCAVLCFLPKGQWQLFYYIFLILSLIAIEDIYWFEQLKSFSFYKLCGIAYGKYYLYELLVALIIWAIPFLIVGSGFADINRFIILLLIWIIILCMWECFYIFIGQLVKDSLGFRSVISTIFILITCIPVIGVLVYWHIFNKSKRMWEKDDIY